MQDRKRKQAVTLLREEISACLAQVQADSDPIPSTDEGIRVDESAARPVLDYLNKKNAMENLSPGNFLNFGLFCHLDFYRLLALVVKGEWQWYVSQRLQAGTRLKEIVQDGLSAVRELSGGFSLVMENSALQGDGLYQLFEQNGQLASRNGYDEKDFQDLLSHMLLSDVYLFSGQSSEMINFIAGEQAQQALLKDVQEGDAQAFWKKKRFWIELENDVGNILLKLEEQTLKNLRVHRKWMSVLGHIYIPLVEAECRFNSLTFRIRSKQENPQLTLEKLDEFEEENRLAEEEFISRLKKNAAAIRDDLPGPGGLVPDDDELEEYETECKKILRKIWRLTHPDRIEQESFTLEQKKKLGAYFEQAVPYQDASGLEDEEIALSMRSLGPLKELLAKVEAVWKSMGLDCNEHSVIQGKTLKEQMAWLDSRILALEEEAGQVRAELMALVNDPETLEMQACLSSKDQVKRIEKEMAAKLAAFEEEIPVLEETLNQLFNEQV